MKKNTVLMLVRLIVSFNVRFTGPVAHYKMGREEVRDCGLCLAVSDEYLQSCKVENVLFRIWFQVKKKP